MAMDLSPMLTATAACPRHLHALRLPAFRAWEYGQAGLAQDSECIPGDIPEEQELQPPPLQPLLS